MTRLGNVKPASRSTHLTVGVGSSVVVPREHRVPEHEPRRLAGPNRHTKTLALLWRSRLGTFVARELGEGNNRQFLNGGQGRWR